MMTWLLRVVWRCVAFCLAGHLHTGLAQTPPPETNEPATAPFTGEPMSMHFQQIELRTALQLVSEFSGVNIIMSDNRAGLPGLHDTPWLGWLFGNRANRRSKQELLIFLSPKMLEQSAFAP